MNGSKILLWAPTFLQTYSRVGDCFVSFQDLRVSMEDEEVVDLAWHLKRWKSKLKLRCADRHHPEAQRSFGHTDSKF